MIPYHFVIGQHMCFGSDFHKLNGCSSACDFMPGLNQTWKIIQIFKKECLHFSNHTPGKFAKTCRQLDTEKERIFYDLHRKSSDYLLSFEQDECKHTSMAGYISSREEKLMGKWKKS
jgi:hypothetical protein